MRPKNKLTDKQKLFCLEYIKDLNATQAAIRAKYSKKTAQKIGSENLLKPELQKEIQKLSKRRFQKAEKSGDDVIKELIKIGFSDIYDHIKLDKNGFLEVKSIEEMKNSGAISAIKETIGKDGRRFEFKLWDKNKALESLGRHFNLFRDKADGPSIQIPEGMTIKFVKTDADS